VPGDRDEWYGEAAELVPLLTHLQPPSAFAQIHYDRFSPYWRTPDQFGLTLRPAFGYEYVYPFPPDVLKDTAYFFETDRQREDFLKYDRGDHPGLFRLVDAVDRWKLAVRSKQRPVLVATAHGDRLAFEDTRPVAGERYFEIGGLELRVYEAAADGIGLTPLIKKLIAEDPRDECGEAAIRAAVQRLIDRKVLVSLSGRVLALAIPGPLRPMAAASISAARAALNPSYGKLTADRALDDKRPSIALSCIRMPHDEPLYKWLASKVDVAAVNADTAKSRKAVAERKAASASRAEIEHYAPIPAPVSQPRVIHLQLVQP
jgi:hypothetical protein